MLTGDKDTDIIKGLVFRSEFTNKIYKAIWGY